MQIPKILFTTAVIIGCLGAPVASLARDHWHHDGHHDHFGEGVVIAGGVGLGVVLAESGAPTYSEHYVYGDDGWGPWADMGQWRGWNAGWADKDFINSLVKWGYTDITATCEEVTCVITATNAGDKDEFHVERDDGSFAVRHWHG